jgi:hypothetical protein
MPQSSLANDEWILDGTPTARWLVGSSIPVKSGTDSSASTEHAACTLEVDEGACVVEIPLRRSPVAVVVGHLIPCLIIVFGGLGALWLDPTVPPLMGGRVGLMITAMLVVGNMSKSVQLRLTTVMWMDFFSMAQFLLLLCALLGTIMVHYNLRNGHKARAVAFDEALRICAWVAYLGVMASVFTYGTTHSNVVFSVTCVASRLDRPSAQWLSPCSSVVQPMLISGPAHAHQWSSPCSSVVQPMLISGPAHAHQWSSPLLSCADWSRRACTGSW